MKGEAVVVVWYKRDQWDRINATRDDRDHLAASYDDWLSKAIKFVKTIEAAGKIPWKVTVDVDEAVAWCAKHRVNVNSKAYNAIAMEKARAALANRASIN